MQWQNETSVVVGFDGENPAFPDLHNAWQKSRHFATGFASTRGLMSRLTGVTIESMQFADTGGEPFATMTLMADAVKHEPVK